LNYVYFGGIINIRFDRKGDSGLKPCGRIRIRKIVKADAAEYAQIAWDESLRRFFNPLAVRNTTEAEELILRDSKTLSPTMLVILYRKKIVGAMTISYFQDEATVNYFIGKQYRRNGYALQSLLVLSEIVKHKHPEIKKFVFSVRKENTASVNLQKSLGSKIASETPQHYNFEYLI